MLKAEMGTCHCVGAVRKCEQGFFLFCDLMLSVLGSLATWML